MSSEMPESDQPVAEERVTSVAVKRRPPLAGYASPAWVSAIAALITALVAIIGILQFGNQSTAGIGGGNPTPAPPSTVVVAAASPAVTNWPLASDSPFPEPSPTPSASPSAEPSATPSFDPSLTFPELASLVGDRADEAGVPEGTTHAAYAQVGDIGLSADVPESWDLGAEAASAWLADGDDYVVIGSALAASPDVDGFAGTRQGEFDAPGFFLTGSGQLAADFRSSSQLDARTAYYAHECRLVDRGKLRDRDYSGLFELFSGCAGKPNVALNVELLADDKSHVVTMHFRVVSNADIAALRRVLSTFEVDPTELLR